MTKHYIHKPVGRRELRALAELAKIEEAAFFDRNPHLTQLYRNRLVAVALCQGAALQYLGCGYGVNDFDIHFFYSQNPKKPLLARAIKRLQCTVGSFQDVPVDFVRTIIPARMPRNGSKDEVELLRAFLLKTPTANARHLAKKGVVLLSPLDLFGKIIWGRKDISKLGPSGD